MFGTVIVLTLLTDFDEWQLGDVSKFMRAIWHMLEHEYSKQSDSCHCMFNCCFSNRILRSEILMYLLNWYWEKFVNLVKMSCSAAEIAEKRRLAKERLQKTLGTAHTPKPSTSSNTATSPGTDAKPTSVFYGNGNNEKAETLNQYENKMKHQPSHRTANRISSQPYPVRDGAAAQSTSSTNTNNNARKVASIFEKVISCTCSMISSTRFQVKESGYSAKLIDVYKSIQTRSFGKCWNEKNRNFSSIHALYFQITRKRFGHLIWAFMTRSRRKSVLLIQMFLLVHCQILFWSYWDKVIFDWMSVLKNSYEFGIFLHHHFRKGGSWFHVSWSDRKETLFSATWFPKIRGRFCNQKWWTMHDCRWHGTWYVSKCISFNGSILQSNLILVIILSIWIFILITVHR